MPQFTVDTKLFRELGELLVGRETTALVELIKNAYDADATKVTVFGKNLTSSRSGEIVVDDNGIGMTRDEFERGFLRIAGRTKLSQDRRSLWFKRRYTGEKGIGRLAAHKLARELSVLSRRWDGHPRDQDDGFKANAGIQASIDWDAIEELETLDEVEGSDAVDINSLRGKDARSGGAGTQLTLSPLRQTWDAKALDRFIEEVATLFPPKELVLILTRKLTGSAPVLEVIKVRDSRRPGDFDVEFQGEFRLAELELPAFADSANWIIEIDCDADKRSVAILVAPTIETKRKYPPASPFRITRAIPRDQKAVSFQARIFQRENKAWPRAYRGVRVYHEGFRILPYGDPRDDWLDLDKDYRSRGRGELGRLQEYSNWKLPSGSDGEGLVLQGNNSVFGAVFLTREGASGLKLLANREGFLPSTEFEFVGEIVRLGIDIQVRQRYAATSLVKDARAKERDRQRHATEAGERHQTPSAFIAEGLHSEILDLLKSVRRDIGEGKSKAAAIHLTRATDKVSEVAALTSEHASEATIFRVLASLGLEHAAFIHEVHSISVIAQGVATALDELAATTSNSGPKNKLKSVAADVRSLRERLRRNAIYLTDMTGIEGRRRRSRQNLRERFEKTSVLFQAAAERRNLRIQNRLEEKSQTPPMFPAEVSAIFSNLLSNAIKFAGENGRVAVSSSLTEDDLVLRMENTGVAVDLLRAQQWFEPFKSSTTEVDNVLGQGMGLGLTITRSLVEEYGGSISFVEPNSGFATAIAIRLPKK